MPKFLGIVALLALPDLPALPVKNQELATTPPVDEDSERYRPLEPLERRGVL